MKRVLLVLLWFVSSFAVSQNLEEAIYTATETFIANKNTQSLKKLSIQESTFKAQISTKDEHLAFVFLLCNKAYYLKSLNQFKKAITSYEAAWKRYSSQQLSSISDYDIIEYCLKPLGNLYTKTNNYTDAENTIKQYLSLAKKTHDNTQYIAGVINLSVLYQTRGMHQSVVDLINNTKQIKNIKTEQKNTLNALKTSSLIALNKASNYHLENDTLFPNTENLYTKEVLEYELALKKGDYQLALKHLNRSTELQKRDSLTKRDIAKSLVKKAQLHYLLGNFKIANQNLQSALHTLLPNLKQNSIPEKTSLYAENTFIDIFDILARLQGQNETALAYYDLSFYVSHLLIESLTSQESKITNQINNRKRSEYCIDLLFESYQTHSNIEFFKRALQYAETHKAFVLKDVSNKKMLLKKHPNDSLLLREQQLLKNQEQLTSTLIKAQLGYQTTTNDSLNKQLLDISMALKTLQKQIDSKYPQENNTIAISKIQKQLALDQANIIIFFYGERALYQFVISEENTAFLKIALDTSFKNTITNFIHLFDTSSAINNNVQEFTKQAFNLYQSLHLNETLASKNLIIIPDGLLNFIPFEALLTEKTQSSNFSKMSFLVTKQHITYNSSITFYLQKPEVSKNHQVLGVFPVFKDSNQALSYSIDESKAIEKEMDATILLHSEASKDNFLKSASNFGVLHISTHANGGDFIHPASIAFYDKPMLLHELYSLNMQPELVVLSACETGVGKLQKGEGAMSLARGFQYAGAKNILFSLWQINDASTTTIMSLFYKNYQLMQSASVANSLSKLAYLQDKTISNIKKSPYYWSAFVYYGHVTPEKKSSSLLYYFFGILALFIVVFLYSRKQKLI